MSLITNKPKAIIYCAENLISGKKYIGRTLRSLEVRRKEHFSKTIKCQHRFATALKCYPEDSWNFYILAEVEYEKADEYEFFFINDLDTCNPEKGYNTLNQPYLGEGETNINFNPEVYHLYHFEHKEVSGNRVELMSEYPELKYIRNLINRKRKQINGFVLLENKDDYEKITNRKTKIGRNCNPITLHHSSNGTHTLIPKDFVSKFGLVKEGISHLKSGRIKSHKGWRILEDN